MKEQVQELPITALHPFRNHPFQVRDDESLQALCDSIRDYGVLSPLLARPTNDGFEIVSELYPPDQPRKASSGHGGYPAHRFFSRCGAVLTDEAGTGGAVGTDAVGGRHALTVSGHPHEKALPASQIDVRAGR